MSIADRGQPVEVSCGPCRCPGAVHTLDTVWLKPELDVPLAIAANAAIRSIEVGELSVGEANSEVQYALTGVYLRHSIIRWSFVDEKSEAIPITNANITRLLPWGNGGGEVAEAADSLYSEALFAPLVEAVAKAEKEAAQTRNREQRRLMKKSSHNGQTGSSTSAIPSSGPTHLEPSLPSSPGSSAGEPLTP
jgi:hypothetical protein